VSFSEGFGYETGQRLNLKVVTNLRLMRENDQRGRLRMAESLRDLVLLLLLHHSQRTVSNLFG
jgi:hypothetical protein